MRKYLIGYLKKYPHSKLQDVFKFIYQDIFGPGHLIKSFDDAYNYLKEECLQLSPSTFDEEALYDEISDQTIRVNLRPYLQSGYDLKILVEIMMESQSCYISNLKEAEKRFYQHQQIVEELLNLTNNQFEEELKKCITNNFKPFSHSKTFHTYYRPHYRIVAKQAFLKHIKLS